MTCHITHSRRAGSRKSSTPTIRLFQRLTDPIASPRYGFRVVSSANDFMRAHVRSNQMESGTGCSSGWSSSISTTASIFRLFALSCIRSASSVPGEFCAKRIAASNAQNDRVIAAAAACRFSSLSRSRSATLSASSRSLASFAILVAVMPFLSAETPSTNDAEKDSNVAAIIHTSPSWGPKTTGMASPTSNMSRTIPTRARRNCSVRPLTESELAVLARLDITPEDLTGEHHDRTN